jgi:adenylate cyclase
VARDEADAVSAIAPSTRDEIRGMRRTLGLSTLRANLVGGLLAFFYFRFIDDAAVARGITPGILVFFVVTFAILIAIGQALSERFMAPLVTTRPVEPALVRRRAIQLPLAVAGVTTVGWVLAGITWGIIWPLIEGVFTPTSAFRTIFGITVIGGSVTTAFIFFNIEHHWRKRLPRYFPEGDLGAVSDVARVSVRVRLLVVFLLVGVVPLALLGVMAYRRALAVLGADPVTAAGIVQGMLPVIAFLVIVPGVAAVGLAVFVANSVAGPLRALQRAMGEVGEGNLDAQSPVVSNDEIGAVAEGFNRMLAGLRERDFVKETFGKYVTREIRDEILGGRIALEGETREVTVLFADLRDFTPWVEANPPREVLRDLNAYFAEMNAAIRGHGGLVVQFIGDEIEAVFGAPVPEPAHARRAVRAALEMRRRLVAWNAGRREAGKPLLRHGIGVHTGSVLAGNIGSAERLSYALVGDTVNLASRIQGLTKEFGVDILISGVTRQRLDDAVAVEALPATRVKGRVQEVEVFRVI